MPSFDETIKTCISARIPVIQISGPDRQYIKNCILQAGMDLKTHVFFWDSYDKMHCVTRAQQIRETLRDIEQNYTIIDENRIPDTGIGIFSKIPEPENTPEHASENTQTPADSTSPQDKSLQNTASQPVEPGKNSSIDNSADAKNTSKSTDTAEKTGTAEKQPLLATQNQKEENAQPKRTITRAEYNRYLNYSDEEEFHYDNNNLSADENIMDWFMETTYKNIVLVAEDVRLVFRNGSLNTECAGMLRTLTKTRPGKILILLTEKGTTEYAQSIDILRLRAPYPDKKALINAYQNIIRESEYPADKFDICDEVINALNGLSLSQASNILRIVLTQNGQIRKENANQIQQMKKDLINASGMLEFVENDKTIDELGGLDNLKEWLKKRTCLTPEERKRYNLDKPKGILLIGPPGTGKTLGATVAASILGVPLLRFEIPRIYDKWLGESEQNLQNALAAADALAPCVLFCDEIEKYLAGVSNDTSTTSSVDKEIFGMLINWMGRKTTDVFVIAAGNSIQNLPPEFSRKGRFDEIFLVNYPGKNARKEILTIHLKKHNIHTISEEDIEELAAASKGFSGAEIANIINESLIQSLYEKRELNATHLYTAFKNTIPQSRMENNALQNYINDATKTARPASSEEWDGNDTMHSATYISYQ